MTNLKSIQVIDSWDLTSIGIIADLKHDFDGLRSGLTIKSKSTNNEWRVKKRLLFHHTLNEQKKFPNETTTYTHGSFGGVENMISSAKNILDRELQKIFQYQLQPIGHDSKPEKGDILMPVIVEKFPCPCCGYKTFEHKANGSYGICQVCFWEDDPIQLENPNYKGGANPMSLREAQQNFLEFGACDKKMLRNVRPPSSGEERDETWKPFA